MMDALTWGMSLLRLYLEDTSRGIMWRTTKTSLLEAHRALIAHRTRALEKLEGEARRVAAEQLCVLRGYAAAGVGEVNAAGEDTMVRAAADGSVGAAGVALLLAAGVTTGSEALVAAATHGQLETAAALVDNVVPVDSRSDKVRRTCVYDNPENELITIFHTVVQNIMPQF